MNRLVVELTDFADSARILDADVAGPVSTALARLSSALASSVGMAGDDPAGRAWADAYDSAARSVFAATGQVARAAYSTSALFRHSAVNYARAESASTSGGPHTDPDVLLGPPPNGPVRTALAPPPGAVGSGGGTPTGWGVVEDLVGYVWPNGHQDRLRRASDAYRTCAEAVDAVAFQPIIASVAFTRDALPEADDIAAVCVGLRDRLGELASAHRTLSRACAELADHLDECHSEVESELSELGIESGVIQGLGAAASIFTLGAAEVPTQGVQIARIAAVAARVAELIRKFVNAARAACEAVPSAGELAARITRSLEGLAGARLAYAGVVDVGRAARGTSMAMHGREVAATSRLTQASRKILETPKRLIGRKPDGPGVWGNPRTLADHFDRHGAEVGARSEDEYVSRSSDLLERGLNGELPTKISKETDTIRVYDPDTGHFGSFRLDGGTRTYFRPPNPRAYFDRQPGELQ